jgi:metal-dependent amidase/aminoacylase/carboxypeptidase family protein
VLPYELKTGLVVEVGSGEKIIALRADIDALPIAETTGLPYRSQNEG